jgi:outer membrane lipoprotein-sorting protein
MDIKYILSIILLATGVAYGAEKKTDSFQQIKDRLASASCISIGFVSILESDIFKSVDSTVGTAYFARDGRYFVKLGDDVYLSDNRRKYSYSPGNNQVIVQKADSSGADARELFYITRLDEWYETAILTPDKEYKLTRKPESVGSLPDSLRVIIDKRKGRIARISYFDENDEPVSLILLQESFPAACDDARFVPRFPDSVETVKL